MRKKPLQILCELIFRIFDLKKKTPGYKGTKMIRVNLKQNM